MNLRRGRSSQSRTSPRHPRSILPGTVMPLSRSSWLSSRWYQGISLSWGHRSSSTRSKRTRLILLWCFPIRSRSAAVGRCRLSTVRNASRYSFQGHPCSPCTCSGRGQSSWWWSQRWAQPTPHLCWWTLAGRVCPRFCHGRVADRWNPEASSIPSRWSLLIAHEGWSL